MTAAVTAYVALGGNLEDVLATFRLAIDELGRALGSVAGVSPAFRTLAVVQGGGPADQPDYWNAVVGIVTTAAAPVVMEQLLAIERAHGRERGARWASRTLDLDLLLYGDTVIDTPTLVVPHPRLSERSFVLRPLCELDPDVRVPPGGATVGELLGRLPDRDAGILYRLYGWWRPAR